MFVAKQIRKYSMKRCEVFFDLPLLFHNRIEGRAASASQLKSLWIEVAVETGRINKHSFLIPSSAARFCSKMSHPRNAIEGYFR
jgi:hypothetical protein